MVVGFKGSKTKLKELYKELGLKEVDIKDLKEFKTILKNGELAETDVIVNYNELMNSEEATADVIEHQEEIMKILNKYKKKLFLGMTYKDGSLDTIKINVAIETKVSTKDMDEIQDLYNFVNTDLSYNGKLDEDRYVVKTNEEERGLARSISDIKKIIK